MSYDSGTKTADPRPAEPGAGRHLRPDLQRHRRYGDRRARSLNTAVISEAETDPNTANKTAERLGAHRKGKADVYVRQVGSQLSRRRCAGSAGRADRIHPVLWKQRTANADNVVITDAVPANTTFVSATGGGTESSGTVTWNLGTLSNGATGTVTLTVRVNSPLPAGVGAIANTATICDQHAMNPQTANNTSSTSTSVTAQPDLVITKTDDGKTQVLAGDTVTYTITYRERRQYRRLRT